MDQGVWQPGSNLASARAPWLSPCTVSWSISKFLEFEFKPFATERAIFISGIVPQRDMESALYLDSIVDVAIDFVIKQYIGQDKP